MNYQLEKYLYPYFLRISIFAQDFNILDKGTISKELQEVASAVLEWGTQALENDVFPRGDYKILVELTLVFQGGTVYPFTIRKPGAHHHARFLACANYFLKIQLLSKHDDTTREERDNVKLMAIFISLFYTEAFLKSRLAASAPVIILKR